MDGHDFTDSVELVGKVIDGVGVGVVVLGIAVATVIFGLSSPFGGESLVGEGDVDAGAAEVDHCDEGLG